MSELFNRNRIIAFVLILVAGILGWLGLILVTNPINKPFCLTTAQKWGLVLAIILSSIAWIRNCLTIRPYKK